MRTLFTRLAHARDAVAEWFLLFLGWLPATRAEVRALAELAAENAELIGRLRCWHLAHGYSDPCGSVDQVIAQEAAQKAARAAILQQFPTARGQLQAGVSRPVLQVIQGGAEPAAHEHLRSIGGAS